jgi:hypothetical protein
MNENKSKWKQNDAVSLVRSFVRSFVSSLQQFEFEYCILMSEVLDMMGNGLARWRKGGARVALVLAGGGGRKLGRTDFGDPSFPRSPLGNAGMMDMT